jgi:hypothetical protein
VNFPVRVNALRPARMRCKVPERSRLQQVSVDRQNPG